MTTHAKPNLVLHHRPPCTVVAEVSCMHLGKIERAKNLVDLASDCGVDYVKFQKRNPVESIRPELYDKPHPDTHYTYGSTYLEHRQALELDAAAHKFLKLYCEERGIGYATSVWDMTSAREIAALNPDYIKVPSPCNQNWDMIRFLYDEYGGDVHISTGMTTADELDEILTFVTRSAAISERTVIYHCTSEYPCPFEHLFLEEIPRFLSDMERYGVRVGFSNHGYGIAVDLAAYTLGASWIERHFVDDRALRHSDASASLEVPGLSRLVRDLKAARMAMRSKQGLTDGEKAQRAKLRVENCEGLFIR